MEDEEIIAELVGIRGIGRWTAEMFLIFHLMRPNVLPLDDVGLITGISKNYFLRRSGVPQRRREVAAAWNLLLGRDLVYLAVARPAARGLLPWRSRAQT